VKLEFSDVRDRHRGHPAVCIGHGPSLNPFIDRLQELDSNGYILVGCNEWYHIYDSAPRYWCIANNVQRIDTDLHVMNKHADKTTVVYADSVDWTDRKWVSDNLLCDYLPYDQWHFGGQSCGNPACHHPHLIPTRLTIQEELQAYCGATVHYGGGSSVMVHCMALAVMLGCNPIHVIGVDLDYHKGYARNRGNLISKVDIRELSHYRQSIIDDFKSIVQQATMIGTRFLCPYDDLLFGAFEKGSL